MEPSNKEIKNLIQMNTFILFLIMLFYFIITNIHIFQHNKINEYHYKKIMLEVEYNQTLQKRIINRLDNLERK